MVDIADFLDGFGSLAGEVGFDLVENCCNFHCKYYQHIS